MAKKIIENPSRTLMEYRLLPGLTKKNMLPTDISLKTPLVYHKNQKKYMINFPIVSAAMQSVSGYKMGIEMAKLGSVAFIFASQPIYSQAEMIKKIKNYKAGFVKPKTVLQDISIKEMYKIREKTGFSTFPVVDREGYFTGLITKYDYDYDLHKDYSVKDRMIPKEQIKYGVDITDLKEANRLLLESHKSVLPILDKQGKLVSMVFRKDIFQYKEHPFEVTDDKKRLFAVAAINTHDYKDRVKALADAEVDVLSVDSSDGHTEFQKETIEWINKNYPEIPVIGGNIITRKGFKYLVDAGASAIKVGMGGGSICITQEQKGTGRGLATTIIDVCKERDKYHKETGIYIPIIADGGVTSTKDITIALALGADYVMMGRYFARMEESPTQKIVVNNRVMKPYWGEGSARARQWLKNRYHQGKFIEGVEGLVEYAGRLQDNIEETLMKIKAAMSTCGVRNIEELHKKAVLEMVSALSIREGKPHDILLHSEKSESIENYDI